jgi:hypothetical protein
MKLATLESIREFLCDADPSFRAAAAYYLHLLTTSEHMYPRETVQSVRDALEECWEKEDNLGVLIMLERCLDGPRQ